ncbi:MAG: 16S rRNA (cytidine(1402)-2'-O)-methyltransferase [Candidatus Blackburnbacteria bacterium]|nr:16S rRNA (cytidine(1402)-2'-O)-methyltransferase [Candidatus Blackburnbacteria bacterium]
MGKLYAIATPIGNLEDITLRAIRILKEVPIILAEDTRSARLLFATHKIDTSGKQILSFFEGNEQEKTNEILKLLLSGLNAGLISESGTPLISDPGFKLVREAVRLGIPVEAIPGPNAAITALSVSGLPTNAFLFLGYLPKKESHARKLLSDTYLSLQAIKPVKTIVAYESPHRLLKTLHCIYEIFGDVDLVVARELTKVYEEVRREKVSFAIEHFTKTQPRGEFVLLFSP